MRRTHLFTFVLVVALAAAAASARQRATPTSPAVSKDVAAVRAVIDAQAAAWNHGDIAGYMDGYAKEESITFVSGDTVTYGWQTVFDRYRARYDTREKMGTLAFTELSFKTLGEAYILASGRWQLTRKEDVPHGRFTLIFRRTGRGWRIIHDHTSSAG